ncbi:hypothetical protein D0T84_05050 [Dysgonomonas sp. 521]|uniref:hypothetical protein n=1 Tax=Dysgonomonas sp. 521 TaxID=2302932 RepID=UPI0013D72031|nr:hypothetical protein [Dysgonomonas sp. 521]NDV94287.1 hypothetical protein [Dysgonomonas sp. 521]
MYEFEEQLDYDSNIPEAFREVQICLNSFVEINYETMLGIISNTRVTEADIRHYHSKVIDIIRNNPPLESLPRYLREGREDYLWYSEFYDDAGKDLFRQYSKFTAPTIEINKVNYTKELTKIDLPYFKELVDLVSLERLCIKYEKLFPTPSKDTAKEKLPTPKEIITQKKLPTPKSNIVKEAKAKPKVTKRSYQPKLSKEQYTLLADCIEKIRLFRLKVKISEIKKLLAGKLAEPLQVTNQKSLVYLFDQLMDSGHIKDTWVSVADGNKDFISFRTEGNKERYGDNTHYINMQQLLNCRNRNKKERITGLEDIEDLIEQMRENSAE